MLKGPKRSFFVVIVHVLGVESKAKNVPNGTKIVHKGTKNVLGIKMFLKVFCGTFWY